MINIKEYNDENVFAKILEGNLPCEKVFENEVVLAFNDINPQSQIHIIVIPKKKFCSFIDFYSDSDSEFYCNFFRSLGEITKQLSLEDGYRIVCNVGVNGGQEVPHLHFHILGGNKLGRLVP
tara:strand:+ start:347 stop:712 length:366 start_codon:yes stop_codon:yes gene_type:complete